MKIWQKSKYVKNTSMFVLIMCETIIHSQKYIFHLHYLCICIYMSIIHLSIHLSIQSIYLYLSIPLSSLPACTFYLEGGAARGTNPAIQWMEINIWRCSNYVNWQFDRPAPETRQNFPTDIYHPRRRRLNGRHCPQRWAIVGILPRWTTSVGFRPQPEQSTKTLLVIPAHEKDNDGQIKVAII